MNTLIATEFRCTFVNGEYYLAPQVYTIFQRYSAFFGNITLLCRCVDYKEVPFDHKKANFIQNVISINRLSNVMLGKYDDTISVAVKNSDFVIGRLPSVIAYKAFDYAKKYKVKYLAELMCDGWLSYWHHGLAGKIIAPYMHKKMQSVTKGADFAIYVTEKFLQNRYPCGNPRTISASNVVLQKLDTSALKNRIQLIKNKRLTGEKIRLITTADVDTRSKGHRYVIEAIKDINASGIDVEYYMIGGGDQTFLRNIAQLCGVADKVVFLGRLNRDQIFKELDQADIYIHPSLQEGLPRAMIEAMSRACPCLGARTAGIPELIDSDCVFSSGSASAIVKAVKDFVKKDLSIYAKHNFEHSAIYLEEKLNARREAYFTYIKEQLE